MARPRVVRFAEVLRRLADRLNPPAPEPPAPAKDAVWRSREEIREIQRQLMATAETWFTIARDNGRGEDGLLWVPTPILGSFVYFMQLELDNRDRDVEAVERDPAVRLR